MPVIKAEFQLFPEINPETKKLEEVIYIPKVDISITVQGKLYPFKISAYVDSGATRNLFPSRFLEKLSIPLDNGRKRKHVGIGGINVDSYIHEADIIIGNYTFTTEIDFSAEHKPPLLGMEKFFNYFEQVNFNMGMKQLELTYINPKHN